MADVKISDLTAGTAALTDLIETETSGGAARKLTLTEVLDLLGASGTWTPVLTDGTNNATMALQDGRYKRLANVVFFSCRVSTSALGSVTGGVFISGLPTAAHATDYGSSVVCGRAGGLAITAGQSVAGNISAGETRITLRLWDNAVGATQLQSTEWSDDGSVDLSGFYFV